MVKANGLLIRKKEVEKTDLFDEFCLIKHTRRAQSNYENKKLLQSNL